MIQDFVFEDSHTDRTRACWHNIASETPS